MNDNDKIDLTKIMEINKQSVDEGAFIFPELLVEREDGTKDMLVLGFLVPMKKRGLQMFNIGVKYGRDTSSESSGSIKSVTLSSSVNATDIKKKEKYEAILVVRTDVATGVTGSAMQRFKRKEKEKGVTWIGEIEFNDDVVANMTDRFLEGFKSVE